MTLRNVSIGVLSMMPITGYFIYQNSKIKRTVSHELLAYRWMEEKGRYEDKQSVRDMVKLRTALENADEIRCNIWDVDGTSYDPEPSSFKIDVYKNGTLIHTCFSVCPDCYQLLADIGNLPGFKIKEDVGTINRDVTFVSNKI